jgi:hypothetical protein
MSKDRYNQIVEEVWRNYLDETMFQSDPTWLEPIPLMDLASGEIFNGARQYNKESFLRRIKTDEKFSRRWGLSIEEISLNYEERYHYWFRTNYETGMEYNPDQLPDFDNEYYTKTPTKLIIMSYNKERFFFYE